MNWKTLVALLAVLLLGVVLWSVYNQRKWVQKDVELQIQIEGLKQDAAESADRAAQEAERGRQSEQRYQEALKDKKAAEGQLALVKAKVRKRPVSRTHAQCMSQLGDCDETLAKTEVVLDLADDTIFACDEALGSCRAQTRHLEDQVVHLTEAQELTEKRVDVWQQQTRKGRVKTAFFGIGMGLAGGAIGAGAAIATNR